MTSDGGQRRTGVARSVEEESTDRFRAGAATDTDRLTLNAYTAAIDEGWTECELLRAILPTSRAKFPVHLSAVKMLSGELSSGTGWDRHPAGARRSRQV